MPLEGIGGSELFLGDPTPLIDPTLGDQAISALTSIKLGDIANLLFGKPINIFAGGMALLGAGRVVEGPSFRQVDGINYATWIASAGIPLVPGGVRIKEILLDGYLLWNEVNGLVIPGWTIDTRTGTETQMPFQWSIDTFGDQAVPYRPHILVYLDGPIDAFENNLPFASVGVKDYSMTAYPESGVSRQAFLEALCAYAGLEPDDFFVRVEGFDRAWILDNLQMSLIDFLKNLQNLDPGLCINPSDKLRIVDPIPNNIAFAAVRDNFIGEPMATYSQAEPFVVPRRIQYRFIDVDNDYEIGSATAVQEVEPIPTTLSAENQSFDLPIVDDPVHALAQVANVQMVRDMNRHTMDASFLTEVSGIEVGDTLSYNTGARFSAMQVIRRVLRPDWGVDLGMMHSMCTVVPLEKRDFTTHNLKRRWWHWKIIIRRHHNGGGDDDPPTNYLQSNSKDGNAWGSDKPLPSDLSTDFKV